MLNEHHLDLCRVEGRPDLIQGSGPYIRNHLDYSTKGITQPPPPTVVEAASRLIDYLKARPHHPAHQAILIASGSTEEELREESIIIELDMIQLMEYCPTLAGIVMDCTGEEMHI